MFDNYPAGVSGRIYNHDLYFAECAVCGATSSCVGFMELGGFFLSEEEGDFNAGCDHDVWNQDIRWVSE